MNANNRYLKYKPGELVHKTKDTIRAVARLSASYDLPFMDPTRRNQFSDQTHTTNVRRQLPSVPLGRRFQSYARPTNLYVVDSRKIMLAHVSLANTAESTETGFVGALDRFECFHTPLLFSPERLHRRRCLIGHTAITPSLQQDILSDPGELSPFDITLMLALNTRKPQQPVEVAVWSHQESLKAALGAIGLQPDVGEEQKVYVLGEDQEPFTLELWESPSVLAVQANIYVKEGAEAAIQAALNQVGGRRSATW